MKIIETLVVIVIAGLIIGTLSGTLNGALNLITDLAEKAMYAGTGFNFDFNGNGTTGRNLGISLENLVNANLLCPIK